MKPYLSGIPEMSMADVGRVKDCLTWMLLEEERQGGMSDAERRLAMCSIALVKKINVLNTKLRAQARAANTGLAPVVDIRSRMRRVR